MARMRLVLVIVGVFMGLTLPGSPRANAPTTAEQIQRGKYLVLHVAMCVQCHTPRDQQGRLDETRLLRGAPMPVPPPPFPSFAWAFRAPALAGLPGLTAKDTISLLQTGKRPADGSSPNPPMPPFRFTPEDATAVVTYLESLTP
jgi:mono/diheme cytochrome c family protein